MFAARVQRRGFSLVEVLVAMAILIIGIVGILQLFPATLRASADSSARAQATLLAQTKVAELRRDDTTAADTIEAIRTLTLPTDPVAFPEDSRFAYQFASKSLLEPNDLPTSVEDDWDVPRVIVRYNTAFRPKGEILYELRFEPGI
ncbi:prepilin-type N-terminal cleavage/methylation domain-containing protein [bacterium]|nr:prepilin-type N-terminal cleavage/methylation domain-containing protein [bacterium]